MAGQVSFGVTMLLDGFIAPESPEDLMGQRWVELQQWTLAQWFIRENLKLGEGGEEGRDNDIARETFERPGTSVIGERMFDAGERSRSHDRPCCSTPASACSRAWRRIAWHCSRSARDPRRG